MMEGFVWVRSETFAWKWTDRFLMLKGHVLLVFKKRGDPSPRKQVILNSDCYVTETGATDGGKFYEFAVFFQGEDRRSGQSQSSGSSAPDRAKYALTNSS
jgi:hypothetical protein